MNEIILFGLALIAGLGLGIIFFGGLWLTVKIATASKQPALWFLGSLVLRISITLTGFYYIGSGDLLRILSCFIGFICARFLVIHLSKAFDLSYHKKERTHGA